MVNVLLGVLGVAGMGVAIWQFYLFVASPGVEGDKTHLWYAIAGFVVLCVCALLLFFRNSAAEEEIHITQ